MQYVRSLSGSVSKTWNSINPATLSGAIDVIVIEHEDGLFACQDAPLTDCDLTGSLGTLACSPFHVRFGKFSLLRPYEKKVHSSPLMAMVQVVNHARRSSSASTG
jgi:phosphatidate phosphatase LPIN